MQFHQIHRAKFPLPWQSFGRQPQKHLLDDDKDEEDGCQSSLLDERRQIPDKCSVVDMPVDSFCGVERKTCIFAVLVGCFFVGKLGFLWYV
jgi:hypothetical protein